MEKIINILCVIFSFIVGIISKLIGTWDVLLFALVILMVFDYVTGILKACFLKKLDSNVGFWGIIKKFCILIIVSTAHILSNILTPSIPIREVVIIFFISNEGISVLENVAVFVPIPDSLKNALQQLSNNNSDK